MLTAASCLLHAAGAVHALLPLRALLWDDALLLTCAKCAIGLQVDTLMLAMTDKVIKQLMTGRWVPGVPACLPPSGWHAPVLLGHWVGQEPCCIAPCAPCAACPPGTLRTAALLGPPVPAPTAEPTAPPSPAPSCPALRLPRPALRLPCSHTLLGVDQSMVMFASEVEDKSDIIASSSGTSDLVGIR